MDIRTLTLALVVGGSLLLAPSAFAGKPERDRADELKPKIAETQGEIKNLCGCDVGINVDWAAYSQADHMLMIGYALDSWLSAAKTFCEKEADKKAFCENVSSFAITYTKETPEIKYDAKKFTALTNHESYPSDSWITEQLNKF